MLNKRQGLQVQWGFLFIGFLVYFCVFSSLNPSQGYFSDIEKGGQLANFLKIYKVMVFAMAALFCGSFVDLASPRTLKLGLSLVLVPSFVLAVQDNLSMLGRLSMQALESIGEGVVSSAVAYLIRKKNSGDYAGYFSFSISWRAGTLVGAMTSIGVGRVFFVSLDDTYVWLLFSLRLSIVVLLPVVMAKCLPIVPLYGVPPRSINSSVLMSVNRKRACGSLQEGNCFLGKFLALNSVLGALSASLFFTLALSPVSRYSGGEVQGNEMPFLAVIGNYLMSLAAVVVLWCSLQRSKVLIAPISTLRNLHFSMCLAIVPVSLLWVYCFLSEMLLGLATLVAVYGFFSMSAYQIGELLAGETSRLGYRGVGVVRYIGIAKLGQVLGILSALLPYYLHGTTMLVVFVLIQISVMTVICIYKRTLKLELSKGS